MLGVLGLAVVAVLTVGGVFVRAVYLEPWSTTYAARFDDPRVAVVAQALLAPSGHNMQPWNVHLDPEDPSALTLFVDPTRLTPAVDPLARQTLVSQGTFLAYLQVSARQLGYSAAVELFPDGAYDESRLEESMAVVPVARVTLTTSESAADPDYGSLFLSDTNRGPYGERTLTVEETRQLEQLQYASGATLDVVTGGDDMAALATLAVDGTRIETEYDAATRESDAVFSSTESEKNVTRSGFAVEGQGTSGAMVYLLQGLITIAPALNDDASAARNAIALTGSAVTATPAYALISTAGNSRVEQVEAGMLYGRLSLRARTLGLVMQPLSQVLQEYPTMAGPYGDVHRRFAADGETIQMLVRVGTATTEYPVTMRRDAEDFLR